MPPKRKSSAVSSSASALAGLTFCMTGTMSVSRSEMEGFIQANGGEVVKTVTNKCTHLMSSESGTKKCADAEKKGAIVVDEAWVREQCAGSSEQQEAPPPSAKKAAKAEAAPKKAEAAPKKAKAAPKAKAASKKAEAAPKMEVEEQDEKEEEAAPPAKKAAKAKAAPKAKKDSTPAVQTVVSEAPPLGSSGGANSVEMQCASSSGGKFWRCALNGSSTTVTYGKVGTDGATQVKDHGSESAASKYFEKVKKEKAKKGYSSI
jgi:predicted DNA-binding WGR domain protein